MSVPDLVMPEMCIGLSPFSKTHDEMGWLNSNQVPAANSFSMAKSQISNQEFRS